MKIGQNFVSMARTLLFQWLRAFLILQAMYFPMQLYKPQ